MRVGVAKITLDFYNNDQLKLKRKGLEKLCKYLRSKYNVSALEISDFDELERCVIGFAVVIPDSWENKSAETFVQKICQDIDQSAFARVTSEDWDILVHAEV